MKELWLSVYDTAKILGVHYQTIFNWIRHGECESEKRVITGRRRVFVLYHSIPTYFRRSENKNLLKVLK
jgi:predicted site-specific integrase-resolvase